MLGRTNTRMLTGERFDAWDSVHTTVQDTSGSWGLTHFTEGRADTGVNASVPVVSLTATGAETNIDFAFVPKGMGALLADVPDGTSTSGNKRGARAIDLQRTRLTAGQVCTGDWSAILGGDGSTVIGAYSVVPGGQYHYISGNYSTAMGVGSFITGSSSIVSGYFNEAYADSTWVPGGRYARADRYAMGAHAAGRFDATGDAQAVSFVARNKTTDTTPTDLFLDGSSVRLTIPSGKVFHGFVAIVGSKSDGSAVATYLRKVAIKNVAGTTTLVGSVETIGTDTTAGTSIAITADDTNDALKIEVTGIAAETWRWVATIKGAELAYGT